MVFYTIKYYKMKIDTVNIPKISSEDIIFYTGSNKTENEDLIKLASPNEYWFHVSNVPSCHVVTQLNDNIVTKNNLKYLIKAGAVICKKNSKYNNIKNLEITYTKISNVKLTDRTGSVILQEYKTITI